MANLHLVISSLRARAPRWAAAVPAAVLGLCVAAGVTAPAAHAALLTGSWVAPTANATVSGTVQLDFSTQNSAVTFILPTGRETATVANGEATGTWDTTASPNGQVTIQAEESDALTPPSDTPLTVTVYNAPPTYTPPPMLAPGPTTAPATFDPPAGSTLSAGSSVTVGGAGSADLAYSLDNRDPVDLGTFALPHPVVVPPGLTGGQHSYVLYAAGPQVSYSSAVYTIVIRVTTPPTLVSLAAPSSYFPRRDGYQDSFGVILTSNEAGTAHLFIRKGKKTVAKGAAQLLSFSPARVTAGAGLKPGRYSWFVTVVDTSGNVGKSVTRSVIADGRHVVKHNVVISGGAADIDHSDQSGSCGHSSRQGSSVALTSTADCADSDEAVGAVGYFPALPTTCKNTTITLVVSVAEGRAGILLFQGGTETLVGRSALGPGNNVFSRIPCTVLSPEQHQLQFGIGVINGDAATISHVKISYTYVTFVK